MGVRVISHHRNCSAIKVAGYEIIGLVSEISLRCVVQRSSRTLRVLSLFQRSDFLVREELT